MKLSRQPSNICLNIYLGQHHSLFLDPPLLFPNLSGTQESFSIHHCLSRIMLTLSSNPFYEPFNNNKIIIKRIYRIRHLCYCHQSAFVLSMLDYCSSLFVYFPDRLLDKHQRAQNNAARTVFRNQKTDHVTPLLHDLHWLPVRPGIELRIAILCCCVVHCPPQSICLSLCRLISQAGQLAFLITGFLTVPHTRLDRCSRRSFFFFGPSIWNALPLSLGTVGTLLVFRSEFNSFGNANCNQFTLSVTFSSIRSFMFIVHMCIYVFT